MPDYNITDEDGTVLVQSARKIVTEFLNGKKYQLDEPTKKRFSFDSGIFVTLNAFGELRGCIGFPLPQKLSDALPDASIAAATQDPRFSPVSAEELDNITFEVTILTPPVQIRTDDPLRLPNMIKVGKNGLIVKQGARSGLLLPQVPVEYGWSEKEFLDNTCHKAGLPQDCWKDKKTQVFSFEGIIFKEETPNGRITREKL